MWSPEADIPSATGKSPAYFGKTGRLLREDGKRLLSGVRVYAKTEQAYGLPLLGRGGARRAGAYVDSGYNILPPPPNGGYSPYLRGRVLGKILGHSFSIA